MDIAEDTFVEHILVICVEMRDLIIRFNYSLKCTLFSEVLHMDSKARACASLS